MIGTYLIAALAASAAPQDAPAAASAPPLLASELFFDRRAPQRRAVWTADPLLARFPEIVARLRAEAEAEVPLGPDDCTEWMPCFRSLRHELAFAGERLVTIFAGSFAYLGGAHGAGGTRDWIWDRARGRRLRFEDLFSDWAAARAILQPRLCERLRQSREGLEIECPDVDEVAFGLAEGDGIEVGGPANLFVARTSDYQLGSFAAGQAEVAIEIDAALYALIRADYRADIAPPPS